MIYIFSILLALSLVSCSTSKDSNNSEVLSESKDSFVHESYDSNAVNTEDVSAQISNDGNLSFSGYEVLEVFGDYDLASVINHHNDIKLDVERYTNEFKLNKSESVNIQNNTFVGKYTESRKGYMFENVDYYVNNNNDEDVSFGIDSNTGVVKYYSYLNHNYIANKASAFVLTEEQCLDIAVGYLGKYVDADAYTMIKSKYLDIPEYKAIYVFEFVRFIDGVKTSDSAVIDVTVFGDVVTHVFGTINEMDDAPTVSSEEYEIIEKSVDEKIDSIYGAESEKYGYSYTVKDKRIIKLYDGRYALEYSYDVTVQYKNSENRGFVELAQFVVYLDQLA